MGSSLFRLVYTQEVRNRKFFSSSPRRTDNLQLFKCLRFCQRPTYVPDFLKEVFTPLSAQVYLLVVEVSALCAEFLEWKGDSFNFQDPATSSAIARRARSLDVQAQNVISGVPQQFKYGLVSKYDYPQLPFWIAGLITDPRAPLFVHTYAGFGPCFQWNMIRYARIRLHQLLLILSDPILDEGVRLNSIETILGLEEDISSTICAVLLKTNEMELGRQSTGQDIPGLRSFLLVRSLILVEESLRFLDKRGVYVDERLGWLDDVWGCLQQNLWIWTPSVPDPLEFGLA